MKLVLVFQRSAQDLIDHNGRLSVGKFYDVPFRGQWVVLLIQDKFLTKRPREMGLKESKLNDRKVEELSRKTGFEHGEIRTWHAGFMNDSPTGQMQRRLEISFRRAF